MLLSFSLSLSTLRAGAFGQYRPSRQYRVNTNCLGYHQRTCTHNHSSQQNREFREILLLVHCEKHPSEHHRAYVPAVISTQMAASIYKECSAFFKKASIQKYEVMKRQSIFAYYSLMV